MWQRSLKRVLFIRANLQSTRLGVSACHLESPLIPAPWPRQGPFFHYEKLCYGRQHFCPRPIQVWYVIIDEFIMQYSLTRAYDVWYWILEFHSCRWIQFQFCNDSAPGKLASLKLSWKSNKGLFLVSGMTGIYVVRFKVTVHRFSLSQLH